jgi:Protein of unknown function (DUF3052)
VSSAGYSGTPLPRKLGIRAGCRLLLVDAPAGFGEVLGDLPPGVELVSADEAELDVVVAFFHAGAALRDRLAELPQLLQPAGGLWIAWPKRSSGVASDLGEDLVRELGLAAGLVDNKVCAIDATWSGLRFVRRLRDRPPLSG